jgi:hypothetical protein
MHTIRRGSATIIAMLKGLYLVGRRTLEPTPQSHHKVQAIWLVALRSDEAPSVAKRPLIVEADVGRELRIDLVSKPQARLGLGESRPDLLSRDVL